MSTISSSTTSTTAYKVTADTTGTLVLQTGATPTTAVTVGTDQSVALAGNLTVTGTTTTTGYINVPNTFGFKNRIINGAMVIDQRNAGASVTPTAGAYTLDRWYFYVSQASKLTCQQNAGSVTPPVGFGNYLGVTSSSAYSIVAGDNFIVAQRVEGFNTSDLAWGTANAVTVTLSFWVRSSLTGTFGGSIQNGSQGRSYPFSYSISSANTWEQKSVTIAGDTSGTWVGATNGIGLILNFGLGVGSNQTGPASIWQGGNLTSATGATSVVGTNGATFYITGVQLEKGSTATSFDYRPYGTELQLCQRYYEQYKDQIATGYVSVRTGSYYGYITWQVPKRAAPTILNYTSFNFAGFVGDINTVTSAVFDNQQVNNTRFYANSVGPYTAQSAYVYVNGTLSISSEL